MNPLATLSSSRALWNPTQLDLRSDEILAQLLDRGSLDDWRALYALARDDAALRERIRRVVERTPLPYPRFWLVALETLGEEVDVAAYRPPPETGV